MSTFDFTQADSYILNCSTLLTELPVLERAQADVPSGEPLGTAKP